MADDDIRPTVVVEVPDRQAAADMTRLKIGPSPPGDLAELASPAVLFISHNHRTLGNGRPDWIANNVAVCNRQVFPTVVVEVNESGPESHVLLAKPANPARRRVVVKPSIPRIFVKGVKFTLEVGDPNRRSARTIEIGGVHSHAAVEHPVLVHGDAGGHTTLLESHAAAIEVQKVVAGIVRNVDVGPPIQIEIGDLHAKALAIGPQWDIERHVLKRSLARIAVETMLERGESLRRADVARHVSTDARTRRVVGERPVDIETDVKVGESVAIQVAPGGACAPPIIG